MTTDNNDNAMAADLIEVRPHEDGWLVASGGVPIGFIGPDKTVKTPSGAEYTVREGRGAARLWSSEGKPVANYDREPDLHLKDVATGVVWSLRPDWRERVQGDRSLACIRLSEAFAVEYTLEEAQSTVPERVKLLLAYLIMQKV